MILAYSPFVLLVVCGIQERGNKLPYPSDEEIYDVRQMLKAHEFKEERRALIEIGERAFPIYFRILNRKDVDSEEVSRIFGILAAVKADRSQFLKQAIGGLSSQNTGVRLTATLLLGEIGSARDTAPMVALLSDEEWTVGIAAAKALAKIGDRRALTAMDVWLNSSSPGRHRNEQLDKALRKHIAKYRDELKQRLEKEKKK